MKLKNLFKKFIINKRASIDEIFSMLLGLCLVLLFMVPLLTESLITYLQGQELESVTKAAAERACSFLADEFTGEGATARQGSMGALLKKNTVYKAMDEVVNQVFEEQPKVLTRDGLDVYPKTERSLVLKDIFGTDIKNSSLYNGTYIGSSPARHLCPAPPSPGMNADWCLNAGASTIKSSFSSSNGSYGGIDIEQASDASYRMMILQGDKCRPGDGNCNNYRKSLEGKIHKCIVCARMNRKNIFRFYGFGSDQPVLGCPSNNSLIPCKLYKCGEAVFGRNTASQRESDAYGQRSGAVRDVQKVFQHYKNYDIYETEAGTNTIGKDALDPNLKLNVIPEKRNGVLARDKHKNIEADFYENDRLFDTPVGVKN